MTGVALDADLAAVSFDQAARYRKT